MRLRLRISRNQLPVTNTLWPVSDTQKSQTIAQLLEAVNGSFPLEADNWGLEDYIVTVGGFEALHYHELSAVCKDEDEVVIRPLTYTEVRARTLLGRAQITQDGRKLADGVAFGRPALRQPVRPSITIPERKKRALHAPDEEQQPSTKRVRFLQNGDHAGEEQGYVEGPPLGTHKTLLPLSDVDDGEDDESDEDFSLDSVDADLTPTSSSEESSTEDSSSDSSSDDSSDHKADSETDSKADSDDSSSDDSSDGSSDATSWNGIDSSVVTTAQSKSTANSEKSTSHPERLTGASLPFEGTRTTKTRNSRRRESKSLKYLKAQRILHQDATMSDLRDYKNGTYVRPRAASPSSRPGAADQMEDFNQGQSENASATDDQTELAARRAQLLADIASGGVEIGNGKHRLQEDDEGEAPEELSSKRVNTGLSVADIDDELTSATASPAAKPARPARLSAAQRLIYGGLGVRAPKDEEQRAALRKTLAGRRGPASKAAAELIAEKESAAPEPTEPEFPEDEEDPDWWKSKINLMAVECVDEGVTLSRPPFPFVQYWDPQYQHMQEKEKPVSKKKDRDSSVYSAGKKGKKGKTIHGEHAESMVKYNLDGGGDFLNYDDDDDHWEEGALLGDDDDEHYYDPAAQQLQDEANVAVPDFPELPKDVTTLPLVTEDGAQENDIITYTGFVCSAGTNWQPSMLTRTVQLLSKSEDGWKVKVALRDLPPKEYDEQGRRVYSKFETIDVDGNEDDGGDGDLECERVEVLQWQEMGEPRLLQR